MADKQQVDDLGVPLRKGAAAEVDDLGVPIKKKSSSVSSDSGGDQTASPSSEIPVVTVDKAEAEKNLKQPTLADQLGKPTGILDVPKGGVKEIKKLNTIQREERNHPDVAVKKAQVKSIIDKHGDANSPDAQVELQNAITPPSELTGEAPLTDNQKKDVVDFAAKYSQVKPAIDQLSQEVEENPKDADALNKIGDAYNYSGDRETALNYYSKANEGGDNWKSLNGMASVFQQNGDDEHATKAWLDAVKLNPDNTQAKLNLAFLSVKNNIAGLAQGYIDAIKKQAPDESYVYALSAYNNHKQGNEVAAKADEAAYKLSWWMDKAQVPEVDKGIEQTEEARLAPYRERMQTIAEGMEAPFRHFAEAELGAAQGVIEGTKQMVKGATQNVVSNNITGTLNFLNGAATTAFSGAMVAAPMTNLAFHELPEDVNRLIMQPVDVLLGMSDKEKEKLSENKQLSLQLFNTLGSLALLGAVHGKGEAVPLKDYSKKELTDLKDVINNATVEDVQKVQDAVASIPKDIPEEKKLEVAPLIIRKNEVKQETENVDDAFKPQVKEKLDAINNQIQEVIAPKEKKETTAVKKPVVADETPAESAPESKPIKLFVGKEFTNDENNTMRVTKQIEGGYEVKNMSTGETGKYTSEAVENKFKDASTAPEPETPVENEVTAEYLQEHGEPVVSSLDAEKRHSNGERIFGVHEQDEQPTELKSIEHIRNYASDQLFSLPRPDEQKPLPQKTEQDGRDRQKQISDEFDKKGYSIEADYGGGDGDVIVMKKGNDEPLEFKELPKALQKLAGEYTDIDMKIADGKTGKTTGTVAGETEKTSENEKQPSEKDKKAEYRKVRDEKLSGEIDDLWNDFKKDAGKLSSGIDPERLAKAIKIVSKYTEAGVYKLSDIIDDAYTRIGETVHELLDEIKAAYLAYQHGASDEALDQMDDVKSVRSFKAKQYDKGINEGHPRTDGDSLPADASGEQPRGTLGDVPEGDAGASGGGKGKQGDRHAGKTPAGRKEPERSAGGGERSGAGAEPGTAGGRDTGTERESVDADSKNDRQRKVEDQNHIITDAEQIVPKGETAKIKSNINAIKLLKKLEKEDRNATPEEKSVLAQFTGWGGLANVLDAQKADNRGSYYNEDANWTKKYGKAYDEVRSLMSDDEFQSAVNSTINAHYTSAPVIKGLWDIVNRLGFKGGNVLESSAGIGHILGLAPKEIADRSRFVGYELDDLTGRMLKKLYPESNINVQGYEKSKIPPNSMDLAITNVPFGKTAPYDKSNPELSKFSLHNYFIAKNLTQLKPGGLGVFITSSSSMDNVASEKFRDWVSGEGNTDFLGAIRLPNNAFDANAGTQVTTDVMVFRKRDGNPLLNTEPFKITVPIREAKTEDGEPTTISVNEYYARHPEMMLGEMMLAHESGKGGLYTGDSQTLHAKRGTDVMAEFKKAIEKLPQDLIKEQHLQEEHALELADDAHKDGALILKDGKVKLVSDGALQKWDNSKVSLNGKTHSAESVAKNYIGIKSTLNDLIAKELSENLTDEDIAPERKKLNDAYDAFVDKYGTFSKNKNLEKLLGDEPDYPLLQSIEKVHKEIKTDDSGKIRTEYTVSKDDIFSKRVNAPREEPISAENVSDAIAISQSYRGNIDLSYVGKLVGLNEMDVKRHILDEGLGFENPNSGLIEGRDQYLSGFVRDKLRTAEEKGYEKNAEELKKVIPDDIPIGAIQFRLGSKFIPAEGVEEFVKHLTDADIRVKYIETTGTWVVNKISGTHSPKNTQEHAGGGINAIDLIEKALNSREPEVKKEGRNDDGKKILVKDPVGTLQAQQKMQEINQLFQDFIRENKEILPQVEKNYNEMANGFVERKQSLPTFQHFPGANTSISLRDHQKLAVLRGVSESTILAHEVGTGKTFTMQTIAMERKRLGLAKKNLLVVKKATIEDFINNFRRLYPQAKILAPTEEQMSAKNRAKLFAKIKTGDYDAIVITEPQLDKIPDDPNRVAAYINEQIAGLESMAKESDDRGFKKEIDTQIKRLQGMLEKNLDQLLGKEDEEGKTDKVKDVARRALNIEKRLMQQSDRTTDNTINFEDMGIDSIIIDEAHGFKRLGFLTNMARIKGIDTQGAKKSLSALMKIRHVQERTQGKNVTLATGTPISNTMAEAWTMMKYVRPDILEKYGIQNFDQFATTFGEVVPGLEYTAGGTFKIVNRFSKFANVPELLKAWRGVADIVLTDDVREFKESSLIPKANKVSLQLPQTEGVKIAIAGFRRELEAWAKLKGKEKMRLRHIPLTVFNKAKQAAIDLRLLDPSAQDELGSKTNRVVSEVFDRWKDWEKNKTTQLVFSDMYQSPEPKSPFLDEDHTIPNPSFGKSRFNLYQDMRNKLIERGIPKEEMAIIHDHDTPAKREVLWEKINSGAVRILFGSTEKSGTGVNVQDKLGAVHHVDAPARPLDFTQRNGRGIRQGNENKNVDIVTYGVEKSLDATSYQRLAIKNDFIKQMMKGNITDRTMEDIGDETDMGFDEIMANLSGNQHAMLYTKKKYDLQGELSKQKAHQNSLINAQRNFNNSQYIQKVKEQRVEDFSKAIDKTQAWAIDGVTSVVTDGKTVINKDIPEHLDKFIVASEDAFSKEAARDRANFIIRINDRNVNIEMRKKVRFVDQRVENTVDKSYSLDENGTEPFITGNFNTGNGLLKSIAIQVKNMPEHLKMLQDDLAREKTNAETYRRIAEKPFDNSKVEALKKEVDHLSELMKQDSEAEVKESEPGKDDLQQYGVGPKAEAAKKIADKIRKGKIDDDISMVSFPFAKEVWNGALEVIAQSVEAGGKLADAVTQALDHIRKSPWYASLSPSDKYQAEKKFADHANGILFDELKDSWLGNIDVAHAKAFSEAANLQREIRETVPKQKRESGRDWRKRWQMVDQAIHVYLDLKRNPGHLAVVEHLNPEQQKIVLLAENLTPEQKAVADKIAEEYKKTGETAQDAGIIKDVLENYVSRTWDFKGATAEANRKFGTSTRHSLQRSLDTILEGWSKGYDLKIKGATNNLSTLKQEIANVVENKNLIDEGSRLQVNEEGDKMFIIYPQEGYTRIEHPLFKKWGFAGDVGEQNQAQVMGKRKDVMVTEKGAVIQKQDVYAPDKIAKRINNIIGTSRLKGLKFFDWVRKANSSIKQVILTTSLFHHQAFLRNKYLSGSFNKLSDLSPVEAKNQGLQAISEMRPELELLIRNGLTIGKIQDWDELATQEKGRVSKLLDRMHVLPDLRNRISEMAAGQKKFLFQNLGAGLKAFDAINSFNRELKKDPTANVHDVAKRVGEMMNNNYGGLNLKRIERNPTTQDIMHLLLLAPDWTESNLRMAVNAFKGGDEGGFNRRMWARVALRGASIVALANVATSMMPDPNDKHEEWYKNMMDRYAKAWHEGKLNWTRLNITPLAHAFGAPLEKDYYYSVLGHYSDPARLASSIADPQGGTGLKFFTNKGSVIVKVSGQALTSQDWKGDTYTSLDEVLGLDGKEKLTGHLTKFNIGGAHPINAQQTPSYLMDQFRGMMPTQVQNIWQWGSGEQDGFTTIANSLGAGITRSMEPKEKPKTKADLVNEILTPEDKKVLQAAKEEKKKAAKQKAAARSEGIEEILNDLKK